MNCSVVDSRIFRNLFGTEEVRGIFSDISYVQRMIDAESALGRAQSKVGIIPQDVGNAITKNVDISRLNLDRLAAETDIVGYPVLPLVTQLVEMTGPEVGKYIHWGATTQDIMDIASILQIKDGLKIVRKQLEDLIQVLTNLSARYRDT
jgi:adenylosuccinate lyase